MIRALHITWSGKELKRRDVNLFSSASPLWIRKPNPPSPRRGTGVGCLLCPAPDSLSRFCRFPARGPARCVWALLPTGALRALAPTLCLHRLTAAPRLPPRRVRHGNSAFSEGELQVSPSPSRGAGCRSDTPFSLMPPWLGHPSQPALAKGLQLEATGRSWAPSTPRRVPFTPESRHCPSAPPLRRHPGSREAEGWPLCSPSPSAQPPGLLGARTPLRLPSGLAPTYRQGGCSASRPILVAPITGRRAGGGAGWHQPETGFLRPPRSATAGPKRRGVSLASDPDGGPDGAGGGPVGERLPRRDCLARLVSTGRAAAGRGRAPSSRGAGPEEASVPSAGPSPRLEAVRHGGGGPRQSRRRSRRAALRPSGRGSRAALFPSHTRPWHLAGALPIGLWGEEIGKKTPKGAPTRVSGASRSEGQALPRSASPAGHRPRPFPQPQRGGCGCGCVCGAQAEPRQHSPKQGAPAAAGELQICALQGL